MKRLVVFDLDGTLALSKQAIDNEMAGLLRELMRKATVAVISGGMWSQFEAQLVKKLKIPTRSTLYCLPCSGAQCYKINLLQIKRLWNQELDVVEKKDIVMYIQASILSSGIGVDCIYGKQFEDRACQVTWSALGQDAPLDKKQEWDVDQSKRKKIISLLPAKFKECFDVRIGGTTSIDVTGNGLDKAYGVRKLMAELGVKEEDILFFGDALFEGGNDYAVLRDLPGVECVSVKSVDDTKREINFLLKA